MQAPGRPGKSRPSSFFMHELLALPDDAVEFGCGATPGCQHGNYVCTPRLETEECPWDWAVNANVPSRGACSRSCHFQRLCRGFSWDAWAGCRTCLGTPSSQIHSWTFDGRGTQDGPAAAASHIIEWHHGWHSGAIMSVWTGKIDLVSEGYISPRAMAFSEDHVLLPGSTPWVTYRFKGNNCLLIPSRRTTGLHRAAPMRAWMPWWEMIPMAIFLFVLTILLFRWCWQVCFF